MSVADHWVETGGSTGVMVDRCWRFMPVLFLAFLLGVPQFLGAQESVQSERASGKRGETVKRYRVSDFEFQYLRKHPDQPALDALGSVEVTLDQTNKGFGAPGETPGSPQTFSLSELKERGRQEGYQGTEKGILITSGALNQINQAIVEYFNEQGLIGVYARPHPQDINKLGEDLRPENRTLLRILIHTSEIADVRTVARGERFDGENNENLPAHDWIREQSPLVTGSQDQRGDLLKKPILDRYVHYLSRYRGRNVDVAVGDAGKGRAQLDYVVVEPKPWRAFAQVTNTGTENTDEIQERVGFIHRQLLGYDDTFRFDYTTADFGDDMNSLQVSYDRPVKRGSRTRLKVSGVFNEFTASDVGIAGGTFEGDTFGASTGFQRNIYQHKRWFLDLTGGVTWRRISTENNVTGVSTSDHFVKPNLGLKLERFSRAANTTGSLTLSHNMADLAGTTEADIAPLGRARAEDRFTVLNGRFSHSFFLEPLIYGESWTDPSTPGTSTRAHEIRVSGRGQYGFSDRLIPQESFIAGGMFSVRGYPESAASGDAGAMGSLEYRLHLPRLLPVESEPPKVFGSPFRFSPENVFGTPDWDFVLSAFLDAGRTVLNDKTPGVEFDETLLSYGVGAELVMLSNLRFQSYYGIAASDLDNGVAESGDDEFHFLFQVSY